MQRINRWVGDLTQRNPWTNVYGLSRSIFALGTAVTLTVSEASTLFAPIPTFLDPPRCSGLAGNISLFCLVPIDRFELARRVALIVLLVVASGWRPRITGLPHWWISFSFVASTTVQDGGDQVAAIVTLFLIPWTLTDPRRWHWQRRSNAEATHPRRAIVVHAAHFVIRVQVAAVYIHSATSKLWVPEWVDGTAMYYFLQDPLVGLPGWMQSALLPAIRSPILAAALTWGALAIEFALALGLIAPRRWRRTLLVIGVLFHLSIATLMGVASFSVAMIAALILYLRPPENEFGWLFRLARATAASGRRSAPALAPHQS
jgi:antimicrobial peptide system SdpB family protein